MTSDNNKDADRKQSEYNSVTQSSRRRFLTGVAATGGLVAVGGVVYAQQGSLTTYSFDGKISGWQGNAPDGIAGKTNPTLNLTAGNKYEVKWTNLDGAPHNFAILGSNGNVLHKTEIMSNQGAAQTTTFTASKDMVTYLCQVHPNSMVGDIAIGSGNKTTTGNLTSQNQTAQNQTETPVNDENVSDLPEKPQPTGPLAKDTQKFIAHIEPKKGVETNATGTAYFTLYPRDSTVAANILFTVYVNGLNNITAAHIHLDRPDENNPIVVGLYPTNKLVSSSINESYTSHMGNATSAVGNHYNTSNTSNATGSTNGTNPRIPADVLPGTNLADSQLVVEDLVGPFKNADSLLSLVKVMNNGGAFVQVHTKANPGGAILGTIMPVQGTAQQGGGGNETTGQTGGGNQTEQGGNGKAKSGTGKRN